jgi:hypothetical protein
MGRTWPQPSPQRNKWSQAQECVWLAAKATSFVLQILEKNSLLERSQMNYKL